MAVLAVAGGLLGRSILTGPERSGAAAPRLRTSTATVERRDLTRVIEIRGNVGFGESRPLAVQRAGTVTALAPLGAVVDRGQELLRMDNRPIVLLLGPIPMWRRIAADSTAGPDIRQIEENLKALGHADGLIAAPDDSFDAGTAAAVKRWQKAAGLDRTGAVEPGDIVFLPTPARVADHGLVVGATASPGTSALQVTSTTPVVTARVKAEVERYFTIGESVEIDGPQGVATGSVVSLQDPPSDGAGGTNNEGQAGGADDDKVATITLSGSASGVPSAQAHVTVRVRRVLAEDVLAVPIRSLLAVDGGTFAVEVIKGGSRRTVAVEIGVFADGFVEVRGRLGAGDRVVVPA